MGGGGHVPPLPALEPAGTAAGLLSKHLLCPSPTPPPPRRMRMDFPALGAGGSPLVPGKEARACPAGQEAAVKK